METIKYNKEDIATQFPIEHKLKDIVAKLEQMAEADHKVICRLRVNGLLLSENDENRFAATEHKDINEIEIELENLFSLISGTVQSLTEFAVALKETVAKTADAFREGGTPNANRRFANAMPAIQCLADALIALKPNLGQILKSKPGFSQRWDDSEVQMMKMVTELIAAYEKQDFVLVSDVLEYELLNSIDNWIELLAQLS
ncbi:MAG: hypothetical protein KDD38_00395 [Bdellovibrionales bacterium]|nr:hypothetical protein [Bdellovibrionales bacterium]